MIHLGESTMLNQPPTSWFLSTLFDATMSRISNSNVIGQSVSVLYLVELYCCNVEKKMMISNAKHKISVYRYIVRNTPFLSHHHLGFLLLSLFLFDFSFRLLFFLFLY